MASRKDYEAEAASIAKHLVPAMTSAELSVYLSARADYYEADNPNHFDRTRFLLACVDTPLTEKADK